MAKTLEFKGIGKSYPGVRALDNVNFKAEGGKVLALLGENGAGKSTLLKILSGDQAASEGEILVDGKVTAFHSPHDSQAAGISVIYQERQLMPTLSVMENLFAGALPKKGILVDRKALYEQTAAIIREFGLDIAPDEQVGRLSIANQQMVEIMKAYRRDSDIIAYDEPTAPLSEKEIDLMFKVIEKQKAAGKAIIYVSHRMNEIFQITDEIVVLKDGRQVTTLQTKETSEPELIKAMVGRDIGDTYANLRRNTPQKEVLLEVKNLCTPKLKNVSFTIHKGEIVGLAGLVGAGRTEVARALFGADPITSGEIYLNGEKVSFRSPREAIDKGIALCPEDRKEQGLAMYRSISDNVAMPVVNYLKKGLGFVDRSQAGELADKAVADYAIKTPTIFKLVAELSGGNQQKVILGRWTSEKVKTRLLILDEPTKGIDVGTKAEIYQKVCDLASEGIGVLFISSELTEVINLADNIFVMRGGSISGCLPRAEATEENVLTLAMADETGNEGKEGRA
ncbi:MAG: sugar ABC transporter ATP-binding protein [Oscillospiraceae bacterium]|nr:sugar ABC transporter ATP-binding protein [Oscillospiraceae bacterium]